VDAAVRQLLERDARGLAADRVEAGQDDGLGRVVDDDVDAGGLLERADVAALAADDAALHLVGRQADDGDGALGGVVGGDALDGEREDVARLALRFRGRSRGSRGCCSPPARAPAPPSAA
jgi:hypothetical protein